ncbi:MAG: hypothetical protein Q4F34_02330, partial [Prevotellaceae bacterium]|nr:hypothetical protein [Prevotellaceae bacterium]
MLTTLIIITIVVQLALTLGGIILWKKAGKKSAARLTKVRMLTTTVRLLVSVAIFAIAIFLIKEDRDAVKVFTIFFAAIYFLLLISDTIYFYVCS